MNQSALKLKKPSAIFLDWDGTLVDSFAFLLKAHNHVRNIIGLEAFTAERFMEYFGQPREVLYRNLYGKEAATAKMHFEDFVVRHHLKFLKPLPGADTLMRIIASLKIPCGIVSNKKGDFIRAEIDNFGWTPLLDAIVGAGEAPQDKPAADPLLLAMALAKSDKNPANVWYIGDSETDAECAKNAGCISILIDHGNNISGWIDRYEPALIIKNCQELTDFLLQWQQK
jgi:phosphoglycolate phosphatase